MTPYSRACPNFEIVASFGVGYDHIDALAAGKRGIIVTHTPDVLTEEVADTAIGLLICTVRELPQAERYLRGGKWRKGDYPLSRATLRNRSVGLIGMGRIGLAIARRLEAFGMPIAYHARRPRPGLAYRHYARLIDMARDVDTLIVIVPGGAATRNMIDANVLEALGPDGILINVARGSVVDEPALIAALRARKIMAAGLDVFVAEPEVPDGIADNGERSAAAASRLGVGIHPRKDGSTSGRQYPRLGRRRAATHAGAGNALAGVELN